MLNFMSRRKFVGEVPDSDSHTAWKNEVRAKRRKFATEFVSRKGGTWMYSAGPFVDNVLRWIKDGASIECRTCGSLVYTLLTEDIVSKNQFPISCETCATCSAGTYYIPQPQDIPAVLQGLNRSIVVALRPVKIHCGTIIRGHRHRVQALQATASSCISFQSTGSGWPEKHLKIDTGA